MCSGRRIFDVPEQMFSDEDFVSRFTVLAGLEGLVHFYYSYRVYHHPTSTIRRDNN